MFSNQEKIRISFSKQEKLTEKNAFIPSARKFDLKIKNISQNKTIFPVLRKRFSRRKNILISRNCSYCKAIFLNQDKVSYRKDKKIFLS